MKRLSLPLALLLLTACATSPLGRHQFLLLPEAEVDQMGATAYAQMKEQQPTVTSATTESRYVQCVADAITAVVNDGQTWEVTVFKDDTANAFALPGGKIGVHTGLLTVAKNQGQLAAVLGHEVGHVIAHHSNERMSMQYATQTGSQLLAAIAGTESGTKQTLFALLGAGTEYGITLPFSRKHEAEADLIGLQLMAKAGFDPQQSVKLWENMNAAAGKSPPEFLSTHPSNQSRIRELQAHMPEANQLYQQAQSAGKRPNCK